MVELRDKETGRIIGSVADDQFQFLIDHLEEESDADRDYYLNGATLDMLDQVGIDPQLSTLLRTALGEREEMEIEWVRG